MQQMEPLSLELVEQGDFLANAEQDLLEAQRALVDHCCRYPGKGGKAKVVLTINMEMKGNSEEGVVITTDRDVKRPKAPSRTTVAMADLEQNQLVVAAAGSRHDHPNQDTFDDMAARGDGTSDD